MYLKFTKMQGLGNDFVMLDLISQGISIDRELIERLADRRLGIGFDQLLTVLPPDDPELDFKYSIFNADGSEAEHCGNGARCFLKFVRSQGLTTKTHIKLQARRGVIECRLLDDGQVAVSMGIPEFDPRLIPFTADQQQLDYELTLPSSDGNSASANHIDANSREGISHEGSSNHGISHDGERIDGSSNHGISPDGERIDGSSNHGISHEVQVIKHAKGEGEAVRIATLNIGNPHAILQVEDLARARVQQLGSLIESHPRFPERVNVSFMEVVSRDQIRLRVFERGVGETRACGTGACAAVVAGRQLGLLDEQVIVTLPGGSLEVHWPGEQASITLIGPAEHVFDGRLQL